MEACPEVVVYFIREFLIGPWRVTTYGNGESFLYHRNWRTCSQPGRVELVTSFPTPKDAFDHIYYQITGRRMPDRAREVGVWLVEKYRTQIRAGVDAATGHQFNPLANMKKQGVPEEFRQWIADGATPPQEPTCQA